MINVTEYPITFALTCSTLTFIACWIWGNTSITAQAKSFNAFLREEIPKARVEGQQLGWHQKEKKNETLARY